MATNNGWPECTVGDLQAAGSLLVEDGNHGEYRPRRDEFCDVGAAFIRAADMNDGRIMFDAASRITSEALNRIRKGIGAPGDVLLSHKGTVGKVAFAPLDAPLFVCSPQTTFWRSLDESRINRRFLYYYLLSRRFREQLDSRKGETDMADYVSLTAQRALKVQVPPIGTQLAIAGILGALDDKIELNRRMNETLEGMARAIFKSWFVDFDPVRAKLDGRQPPGLDAETAALFPAGFEESELGRVPRGWTISPLRGQVDAKKGLSYKGAGLSEVGFPLHNLNSIFEGGGYKFEGIKRYVGEYKDRHIVYPGDVIVANTEQGHDRLLIGYAAIVPSTFGESGLFSHHLYRVRTKKGRYFTNDFICQLLNDRVMHDTVSGYANGTTVNMLPQDALESPLIVVPPEPLVARYSKIAAPIRERRERFVKETHTLARIRDALLPKLLSREICVADAERVVAREM